MKISKTTLVVIIYIIGVILGAFFLDIWGAETSMKKGFIALGWTALFLVGIFFVLSSYIAQLLLPFKKLKQEIPDFPKP